MGRMQQCVFLRKTMTSDVLVLSIQFCRPMQNYTAECGHISLI